MARGVSLVLACAFVAAALLFARPNPTPGPAQRDFEAYWSAGAAFNAGEDPYGRGIWSAERTVPGVDATRDELLPFVGPPATLPLWSVFARFPYATAAVLWWALLALALLGVLLLLARAAGGTVAPFSIAALVLLALGFGPMTSDLALGQIALVALLGATACVCLAGVPVAAFFGAFAAFFQPNVALGLALANRAQPHDARARRRRRRDVSRRSCGRRLVVADDVRERSYGARRSRALHGHTDQPGGNRVRVRRSGTLCRSIRSGGRRRSDRRRFRNRTKLKRTVRALRRSRRTGAAGRGILSRARFNRRIPRCRLVRVQNARFDAHARDHRHAVRRDRLARSRPAADGHAAERASRRSRTLRARRTLKRKRDPSNACVGPRDDSGLRYGRMAGCELPGAGVAGYARRIPRGRQFECCRRLERRTARRRTRRSRAGVGAVPSAVAARVRAPSRERLSSNEGRCARYRRPSCCRRARWRWDASS